MKAITKCIRRGLHFNKTVIHVNKQIIQVCTYICFLLIYMYEYNALSIRTVNLLSKSSTNKPLLNKGLHIGVQSKNCHCLLLSVRILQSNNKCFRITLLFITVVRCTATGRDLIQNTTNSGMLRIAALHNYPTAQMLYSDFEPT